MIEKNDPRLTAYVLGELDKSERSEIEAAIRSSEELQKVIAEIRTTCDNVEAVFQQELSGPSRDLVVQPNGENGAKENSKIASSRWIYWASVASIAALCLSIAGTLLMEMNLFLDSKVAGGQKEQNELSFSKLKEQFDEPTDEQGEFVPNLSLIVPQDSEDDRSVTPADTYITEEQEIGAGEDDIAPTGSLPATPRTNDELDRGLAGEKPGFLSGREFANVQASEGRVLAEQAQSDRLREINSMKQSEFFKALADVEADVLESVVKANPFETGKGEGLRAGFEVQHQIEQTEIQFQQALQKFGSKHPQVESLKAQIRALKTYGDSSGQGGELLAKVRDNSDSMSPEDDPFAWPEDFETDGDRKELNPSGELDGAYASEPRFQSIETTVKSIIPVLIQRVNPTGTEEIEIQKLELDANVSASDFDDLIKSIPSSSNGSSQLAVESALNFYKNLKNETEKELVRKEIVEQTNRKLRLLAEIHNKQVKQRRGWRKVEATGNTSRLIIGDKDELDPTGMQIHVQVDGFRARVLIDYFYYNDRERQLEGNFKIRLPDDASLYYFAFGQSAYDFSPDNGLARGEFMDGNNQYVSLHPVEIGLARKDAWKNVKESRMVPREKAAFAYSQTVRRRVDPALVEWSGAGIFNARVFPLLPRKLHRIVVGYDVNLTSTSEGMSYRLDLPQQMGECRVDLNVTDFANGKWEMELDNLVDGSKSETTRWESDQTSEHVQSQKRMRFESPNWKTLTLKSKHQNPIVLQSTKREQGRFFATQLKVDLEANAQTMSDRAVFLVDTSLSSRPDKFNVWLNLMKSTLSNNQDELKQFAVMFFDVECRFWQTQWTDNTDENVKSLLRDCYQLGLEGATNLHGAVLELRDADWIKDGSTKPDVFLLSDGAANWGETNLRLIENDFATLQLGSLFAYQTGLTGTAIANLRALAGSTGGAVFSVTSEHEVRTASTAHRNKPWKLNSIRADGTKDLMTAGRTEWIYPGQLITIAGRGQIKNEIQIQLSQGNRTKTIVMDNLVCVESELASRLYGHISVGQLESLGQSVFDVSAAYARHFRITGDTCSLLMLETEADYQRFDIKPQEDWFVVQSKNASDIVDETLQKMAQSLADPKTQLMNWMNRLENMPGLEFKMPTALKLAMDQMSVDAIDSRLRVGKGNRDDWSKKYIDNLTRNTLDAVVVGQEMERRRNESEDAALRAYSNLIESNPGDWVAARDVAFTAMDLNRPAAAYHLLRRVIRNRPFEGSTYAAMGQCLDQLNKADLAMIYYELALGAKFQIQGTDFHKIVATNYRSLLKRIIRGELDSSAKDYAIARADSLNQISSLEESDIVISMMWNTDQTDVDLHVIEPSGEECSYRHRQTTAGGEITKDKTDGFGPEMYHIPSAPNGEYKILVKFFGSNQSRTNVTNKIYLTVYENFGSENENITRDMIALSKVGRKEQVKTIQWSSKD